MILTKQWSKPLIFLTIAVCLTSCAPNPAAPPTLFERIGGLPVLTVVVEETIDQAVQEPKTKRSFEGVKLPKLKESVVSHLCFISGGPCVYEGETMANAHHDAQIDIAEYEVFVGILRESLTRHVNTREKNELLKILAPMKRDVVGRDVNTPPTQ